ncbi:hypothetical protein CKF59_07650, partial [Psittacicella gerlachiana]
FNLLYLYYLLTKIFIYLNESVEKESYYQPYTRYLEKFSALKKLENSKIAENKLLYNKNLEGMPASQIFSSLTDESAVLMYFSDIVEIVSLGRHNLKITVPEDLSLAQFYLNIGNKDNV